MHHSFIPHLTGFFGIYCFQDSLPSKRIITSSMERFCPRARQPLKLRSHTSIKGRTFANLSPANSSPATEQWKYWPSFSYRRRAITLGSLQSEDHIPGSAHPHPLATLLSTQSTCHAVVDTVVRQPVELSQPRLRNTLVFPSNQLQSLASSPEKFVFGSVPRDRESVSTVVVLIASAAWWV